MVRRQPPRFAGNKVGALLAIAMLIGSPACDRGHASDGTGDSRAAKPNRSMVNQPSTHRASAPAAKPKAGFHRYAQGPQMTLLGSFGTTAALVVGGVLFPVDAAGLQQVAGAHRFEGLGDPHARVPAWRITGSWPERAFHIVIGQDTAAVSLWRPDATRPSWHAAPSNSPSGAQLIDADAYLTGSVLGVLALNEYDWKWQLFHSNKSQGSSQSPQSPPSQNLPSPGTPPTGARRCKAPLIPKRIATLPSGEVLLLGFDCKSYETGARKLALQRWTPASRDGAVEPLPPPLAAATLAANTAFIANSAHNVLLGTDQGLAHFDGTAWKVIHRAPITTRHGLARGQDGSLWIITGDELHARKATDKPFEPIALPPAVKPLALADAPGALPWLLAKEGNHRVLLGPASKAPAVTIPPEEEVAAVHQGELPAATSACQTLFVPLRMDASPTQRFEDIKAPIDATVQGIRYGFAQHAGRTIFGAIAPSYFSGLSVVAQAKRADSTSAARLCCYSATLQP